MPVTTEDTEISFDDLSEEELADETTQGSEQTHSESEKTGKDAKEGDEVDPLASLDATEEETILAQLASKGITPENAADILTQANAFKSISQLIADNPRLLLDEIEKKFPGGYKNLLDEASERFLAAHEKPADGEKGAKGKTDVTIDRRFKALEDEIKGFKGKEVQQAETNRLNAVKAGFETKLDTILKLPAFEDMKPRDLKAIRAIVRVSIGEDQKAMSEIMTGNFQSVAKHVKAASSDWAAELKSGSEKEKASRDKVVSRGVKTVAAGAHPAAGEVAGNDWDSAEKGFADSLLKLQKTKK